MSPSLPPKSATLACNPLRAVSKALKTTQPTHVYTSFPPSILHAMISRLTTHEGTSGDRFSKVLNEWEGIAAHRRCMSGDVGGLLWIVSRGWYHPEMYASRTFH